MKRDREKKYLQQIAEIDAEIIDLQAEIKMWRERSTSIGSQQEGERVQSSGTQDSMRPADIYMDIELDIEALREKRKSIIADIRSLPGQERGVLFKRYVLNMDYFEIAEKTDSSYSTVTSIHGRGLMSIKKILDERESNGETEHNGN